MKRICPICKNDYYTKEDEGWKKRCYDCWLNYRSSERIKHLGYKDEIYITHPSVTQEELQDWINKKVKEGKTEHGWGVREIDLEKYKEKFKVWADDTNFD